jgi:hypothetical protein
VQLVKNEVYKWLNRYLVLGKLPSTFVAPVDEVDEVRRSPQQPLHSAGM